MLANTFLFRNCDDIAFEQLLPQLIDRGDREKVEQTEEIVRRETNGGREELTEAVVRIDTSKRRGQEEQAEEKNTARGTNQGRKHGAGGQTEERNMTRGDKRRKTTQRRGQTEEKRGTGRASKGLM